MKFLAEISVSSPEGLQPGALRRSDLEAFDGVLREISAKGVVLVTGTGGGRQVCSLGLATAAIVNGRRAALLECDLANPALAKTLGLSAAPGLSEYLQWEAEARQILQPVMLGGPESGRVASPLVCIPAGKATLQGPTLLASKSFRHATEKLRSAYDLVVLDGPSLDSDAAQLGSAASPADASLACVERAKLTRRSAKKLRQRLRQLPPRFAGFVACD